MTKPRPLPMRPLDRLPSIRAKLGAVIVFAVAVTILAMYVAVGFAFRKSERDRGLRELLIQAQTVATLGFNAQGRPSKALLSAIEEDPEALVVLGPDGSVLAGSLPVPSTASRVLDGYLDTGISGGREYLGVPVNRKGNVIGAVYLSHPVEGSGPAGAIVSTAHFVRNFWWQLLLGGAVSAFIALFLARILARGMTQPLRDMAQAARGMARGEYGQRVGVRSRDEVGQLAEAFNRMAGEMEVLERLRRDLVANVSHELKTPISALRARLENLLDGIEDPDPARLGIMLQQTERLSRLVDQLLELSRLESGDVPLEREPVALAPLVERVVAEVRLARPDRPLEVRNLVPPDLPSVDADRERLDQVLFNLLDNAFRFTPPAGLVTITAARHPQGCEVAVEDTGPGIPEEHLPLVFERFYRVEPSRSRDDGGTGIGLAIARSVVEAHGGWIWAENVDGHGARFRFVLPVAEPPSRHPARGAEGSEAVEAPVGVKEGA